MKYDEVEYMSRSGASMLKKTIEEYWAKPWRARKWGGLQVFIEPAKYGRFTRYFIRSNMKNGYPPVKIS